MTVHNLGSIDEESYAELCCVSNFSFHRGASHPEELIIQAAVLGYRALALTDECSLAGAVRGAVEQYVREVQAGEFPTAKESVGMS